MILFIPVCQAHCLRHRAGLGLKQQIGCFFDLRQQVQPRLAHLLCGLGTRPSAIRLRQLCQFIQVVQIAEGRAKPFDRRKAFTNGPEMRCKDAQMMQMMDHELARYMQFLCVTAFKALAQQAAGFGIMLAHRVAQRLAVRSPEPGARQRGFCALQCGPRSMKPAIGRNHRRVCGAMRRRELGPISILFVLPREEFLRRGHKRFRPPQAGERISRIPQSIIHGTEGCLAESGLHEPHETAERLDPPPGPVNALAGTGMLKRRAEACEFGCCHALERGNTWRIGLFACHGVEHSARPIRESASFRRHNQLLRRIAEPARKIFLRKGFTNRSHVATYASRYDAGWSSPVARQAHNLKVVSSNLAPATKKTALSQRLSAVSLFGAVSQALKNKTTQFQTLTISAIFSVRHGCDTENERVPHSFAPEYPSERGHVPTGNMGANSSCEGSVKGTGGGPDYTETVPDRNG